MDDCCTQGVYSITTSNVHFIARHDTAEVLISKPVINVMYSKAIFTCKI